MRKIAYTWIGCGLILCGLSSCEMRDELKGRSGTELEANEGLFSLELGSNAIVNEIETRGNFNSEDVTPSLYTVKVVQTETGTEVYSGTYADLEGKSVKLTVGDYQIRAYNYDGSEKNASERPFFQGTTNFQIIPGKTTRVNTTCKLQNLESNIILDPTFIEKFKNDYSITITNGEAGNYIFTKDNISKKIYFKVPEKATNSIQMSVKATTTDGVSISQLYTIQKPDNADGTSSLLAGDAFSIKIKPGDDPIIQPGKPVVNLEITVDLTMTETNTVIEIPTENIVFNPGGSVDPGQDNKGEIQVTGLPKTYNFSTNMDDPVDPVQVQISAPNGITKLIVRISSDNEGFMSTLAGFGLADPFDLANPGDLLGVLSGSLADQEGIGLIDSNDPILGKTSYLFDVTEFMTLLKLYGISKNTFSITVSDGKNEDVSGDLKINIGMAE